MGSFSGVELPTQYNDFHRQAKFATFSFVGDFSTNNIIPAVGAGLKIVVVHYYFTMDGGGDIQFTDVANGATPLTPAFAIIDNSGVGLAFAVSPGWNPHGHFVTGDAGSVDLTYNGASGGGFEIAAGNLTYLVVPV